MSKQQTAVEWLVEQIIRKHPIIVQFLPNYNFDKEIIQQANEMFEQQIIGAFCEGAEDGFDGYGDENKEQYYNETFNQTS